METTTKTYDVFRAENRANGTVYHVGTVEAPDAETAQREAVGQFECRPTCVLYVKEAPADKDVE